MVKFINNYPPANRGRIIVWGMISSFPFGGMIWQVFHHLVGFRRLGFDVWYVEDSDRYLANPRTWWETNEYAESVEFLSRQMQAIGFENRWIFRPPEHQEICLGAVDKKGLNQLYKEVDCVVNLCVAQELLPYHDPIKCLVYLETDPVLAQIEAHEGNQKTRDIFRRHHHLFSYGENLGKNDCSVPIGNYKWIPTRPPVITEWWKSDGKESVINKITTVGNWNTKGKDVVWNNIKYRWCKDYKRFMTLPELVELPLELTLVGITDSEKAQMEKHRWIIRSGTELLDPLIYHNYITHSLGEFTVAKDQYRQFNTGWFSDRSVCYLAAGRPVITEETGFSQFLPTGKGLFAFKEMKDVVGAIETVCDNYELHSQVAFEIAEEYFKAEKVLSEILKTINLL